MSQLANSLRDLSAVQLMPSGKGRRPRGSKITMPVDPVVPRQQSPFIDKPIIRPNVILRLRHIVPSQRPTISHTIFEPVPESASLMPQPETSILPERTDVCLRTVPESLNDIDEQLKLFNRQVRIGEGGNSKCCHWDSQPFYTAPVHVPLRIEGGIIYARGTFCSPECAVADILHNPEISTDPHEQLALLHAIYMPIYMSTEAFGMAQDPRRVLKCYGGALTIDEYRRVFRSGRQLQALPRPLVKCITEVHLVAPRPEQAKVMRGQRKLVLRKPRS